MSAAMPQQSPRRPVLVVEDNPDCVELYTTELRLSGYDIIVFNNASDALNALAEFKAEDLPEIAVLDGALGSGQTGWVLAEALIELIPNLVVTMVTGWSMGPVDTERANRIGILAVYTKPASIAVIVGTIQQQIDRRKSGEKDQSKAQGVPTEKTAPKRPGSHTLAFLIIGFGIIFYAMVVGLIIGFGGLATVAYHFHIVEETAHERELKQAASDEDKRFIDLQHNLEREQDKSLEATRQEVHDQREALNGLWEHVRAVREALSTHGLMNNIKKDGK